MRGLLAIILSTVVLWPMALAAQPAVEQALDEGSEGAIEDDGGVNTGNISIEGGLDYTSAYIFRGIVTEDEGIILWPWLELSFSLYESAGAFSSLSVLIGTWNSLHYDNDSGSDGANADPSAWFETDVYAGIYLGFIEALELSVVWMSYNSPNSSFRTLKELIVGISYDDSGVWEDVGIFEGIYPWVTLAAEISGQGDGGTGEGIYFEVGVEPTLSVGGDSYAVSVAVPLSVGLSLSDYFEDLNAEDSTFGFFEAGLVVGFPLSFIPESFGEWTVSGNFHVTILSEAVQEISDADQVQIWGGAGIGFSY